MFDARLTYAIHIMEDEDLEILKALKPELKEISFEDVRRHVYIADWPEEGQYAFMTAKGFEEVFIDLAKGPAMLSRLVQLREE